MRVRRVVLLVACGVLVGPCAWAATCSDNCGTAGKTTTTDRDWDWCNQCDDNCGGQLPDCVWRCGTPWYQHVGTETIVTTYQWTGCAAQGETDCTGHHYTQGLLRETQVKTYRCDTIDCCFSGRHCKPSVYEGSNQYTPEYGANIKCVCPGGE